MNASTSSSRTTSEDRARRNAELEELRERGLARQWQQLLAESGGNMPITMDAWIAQQRRLSEEDRRHQQDASDNLHKFRGVGINDLYRNKQQDSSPNITPDSIAKTYTTPEYIHHDDDDVKRQLHLVDSVGHSDLEKVHEGEEYIPTSEGVAMATDHTVVASLSLPSDDRLDFVLSSGDESYVGKIESKSESLADWVVLHDDVNKKVVLDSSIGQTISVPALRDHSQVVDMSISSGENLEADEEINDPLYSAPNIAMTHAPKIYPFNYLNILVSFGLVTAPELAPSVRSYMGTTNDSSPLTDILDQFHYLLTKEMENPITFYKLQQRPFVVLVEKDGAWIRSVPRLLLFFK
jgi:hypothetical protein